MSDQTPDAAPVVVESATTEEQPRELDVPQPAEAAGNEAKTDEPPKEERKERGVEKRLNELRREVEDQKRLADRALSLLERERMGERQPAPKLPDGPPQRQNYATHEDYLEARGDYQINQKLAEIDQKAAQREQEKAQEAKVSDWNAKQAELAAKHDDYYEVVGDKDLPVTPKMAEAILESDRPAEVAYWLGKNPDEAARIAKLSDVAQVREITKIEARLSEKETPATKPVSRAPAPITPVGNGRSGTVNLENASMEDYVAARSAQGASWAPRKR